MMTKQQAEKLAANLKGYSGVKVIRDNIASDIDPTGEGVYYVVADGYKWTSPDQEYAERR